MSEEETPVIPHKIKNSVELAFYELSLVADDCDADNRDALAVLVIDFRDRDIEPALEPPDDTLDDTSLSLERSHALQR